MATKKKEAIKVRYVCANIDDGVTVTSFGKVVPHLAERPEGPSSQCSCRTSCRTNSRSLTVRLSLTCRRSGRSKGGLRRSDAVRRWDWDRFSRFRLRWRIGRG